MPRLRYLRSISDENRGKILFVDNCIVYALDSVERIKDVLSVTTGTPGACKLSDVPAGTLTGKPERRFRDEI